MQKFVNLLVCKTLSITEYLYTPFSLESLRSHMRLAVLVHFR